MSEIEIKVRENGPYLVSGPFTMLDADGNEFTLPEGKAVALCRCGASLNKPFCDATHSKLGFDAATKAVLQAES
jgi:CDGSH-type Zn-finger protein